MVDRCFCHDKTLAELKELAIALHAEGSSRTEAELLAELAQRTGAGMCCGLCRPYVKLTLRTGKTEFETLTTEEWTRLINEDEDAEPPARAEPSEQQSA